MIRGDVDNSQEFNAERLDNLDYWVAQLKKKGIYVNFNLNVGRRFKAGDGVPYADLLGPAKGLPYIGPDLISLQKDYPKNVLGPTHPYPGLPYPDATAVITDEDNGREQVW